MNAAVFNLRHKSIIMLIITKIHIIAKLIAAGDTCFEQRPATPVHESQDLLSSSGISIFITEEGSTGL